MATTAKIARDEMLAKRQGREARPSCNAGIATAACAADAREAICENSGCAASVSAKLALAGKFPA